MVRSRFSQPRMSLARRASVLTPSVSGFAFSPSGLMTGVYSNGVGGLSAGRVSLFIVQCEANTWQQHANKVSGAHELKPYAPRTVGS